VITIGGIRIAVMNKADAAQGVKRAAKEQLGKDLTDNEAEQSIADYFSPTIPPPDISQDQIDDLVESLWGEDK
jgi:hypothetical protein